MKFTPLDGISPGISQYVGLGLHHLRILQLFQMGISPHHWYLGIHLGIPDIHHLMNGQNGQGTNRCNDRHDAQCMDGW